MYTMKAKTKVFNGLGKGEWIYDYSHDILTLKVKEQEYEKSIDVENYIFDFDPQGILRGIQIFDASHVLGIARGVLRQLSSFRFDCVMNGERIFLKILLSASYRNKKISHGQDIERILKQKQGKVICSTS